MRLRVWCMTGEGRRACFTGTVIGSSRTQGLAVHPDGLARAVQVWIDDDDDWEWLNSAEEVLEEEEEVISEGFNVDDLPLLFPPSGLPAAAVAGIEEVVHSLRKRRARRRLQRLLRAAYKKLKNDAPPPVLEDTGLPKGWYEAMPSPGHAAAVRLQPQRHAQSQHSPPARSLKLPPSPVPALSPPLLPQATDAAWK